jgi:hypothetical protein
LPCIEGEHAGLLTYHKYEVASPCTPSTDESHFYTTYPDTPTTAQNLTLYDVQYVFV